MITGGKGFIGSAFIQKYGGDSYDLVNGQDVKDFRHLLNDLHHGEYIVHLAANPGVPQSIINPLYDFQENVIGTFNVLEAARIVGSSRVVFASSGAVLNGESPYAAAKISGEAYCNAFTKSYGLSTIALRFSNVYGPGSDNKTSVIAKMIKDAKMTGQINIYGTGEQTRDFVYIDDVCEAINAALNSEVCGYVHIGSGEQVSIKDIAGVISDLTGTKINYQCSRKGDVMENISPPQHSLAWRAKTPLYEGIKKTVDYFYA